MSASASYSKEIRLNVGESGIGVPVISVTRSGDVLVLVVGMNLLRIDPIPVIVMRSAISIFSQAPSLPFRNLAAITKTPERIITLRAMRTP